MSATTESFGKVISDLNLQDDVLIIKFTDETRIGLFDDGQCCCEHRYFTTDDSYLDFIGSVFQGIELKPSRSLGDDYEVHDITFLEVLTNRGSFVINAHNVHNGYYGGFNIISRYLKNHEYND